MSGALVASDGPDWMSFLYSGTSQVTLRALSNQASPITALLVEGCRGGWEDRQTERGGARKKEKVKSPLIIFHSSPFFHLALQITDNIQLIRFMIYPI